MSTDPKQGFATRAIHAGTAPAVDQTPASVPIYQTSTWRFDTADDFAAVTSFERPGHVYGRGYGNPTVEALEAAVASLEETEAAYAFSSGMAAIHATVTSLARTGDRIVASQAIYGGTYSLFGSLLPRYGIDVSFVDITDENQVASALPGARLFYVETIANPLITVANLERLGQLCQEAGVTAVVDNTFASPYLCTPARYGFDFVVHSATKYLGGHSDLVGGVVATSASWRRSLRSTTLDVGGAMAPFEAWLCLRGLTTLALRMDRHCATAAALAKMLAGDGRVAATHYPGLEGDPGHDVASRQLRAGGGMLAFELEAGLEAGARFCDSLELAWIGASLGGPHTLVAHPASTTHRQLDPDARRTAGLADGLIRVSVGLEDPDDLLPDVAQALDKAA
jgi:cystathionine beta-lyase/cystathionine gamma-synthase